LLAGMWTLPGVEITDGQTPAEALRSWARTALGVEMAVDAPLATIRHAFTHRRLHMHIYRCRLGRGRLRESDTVRWVTRAQRATLAFASVDRKLMRAAVLDGAV